MTNTEFGRRDDAVNTALGTTRHPFIFTGNGREYFGIWIVNILLSIVTLGIYSAWAKVRTKRYFNGNTELAGHRFDYHANPIAILKGRIIVVIVLVAINLISQLNPLLAIGVIVFYAIALPWVIIRGLQFNANMTSYRNIRFHFKGKKMQAFAVYILLPTIIVLTLGLIIPYMSRANTRFLANGHSFGKASFSADPPLKPYYKALGIAYMFAIGPFILFGIGIAAILASPAPEELMSIFSIAAVFLIYPLFIVAFLAYGAISRNISFNALRLEGGHSFNSTVELKPYIWIMVTNFLLTIITLGIYIPWAKVRLARYLADNTAVHAADNLDPFTDTVTDDRGVTSGEFLDIEGLDFGL